MSIPEPVRIELENLRKENALLRESNTRLLEANTRLAAEIATNRFCDHQPYYRQEQHFLMRHGVHLPRNTMSQWMGDLSRDFLSGIYQSMHEEMLSETYRNQREDIELIGCWAHVRRKFFEAKDQRPKLTGWFLNQIQHLYKIEKQLREHRAGPAERERIRISQSLPIYRRLGKALWKIKATRKALPQSNLGKAIAYALGQWPKLELCFKDGRLEIDNNLIENGIRPTKLGAKNWLFMGSEAAGQSNAIWYTLIESCRRRRIDAWKYLAWIFEELPKAKVTEETFASYTPKAYAEKLRPRANARKTA